MLTDGQKKAMALLEKGGNVFLTGSAGTGKSYLIHHYLNTLTHPIPILASTGAAAVLIGGRTFHSYFGLGIMQGGIARTVEKAVKNPRVSNRIYKENAIIIDEVSMIHPEAFLAAHQIAQRVRFNNLPFGGLRVIVVGDFLQLPPVNPHYKTTEWLFESPLWQEMGFEVVELTQSMRTESQTFVELLNKIRIGRVTDEVAKFLNDRVTPLDDAFDGTVLVPRRAQAEAYNLAKLRDLESEPIIIETQVLKKRGTRETDEQLLNLAPVPDKLILKADALVMIRKNDQDLRFVNGSLARVKKIKTESLHLQLTNEDEIELKKEDFHILNGDGEVIATIRNFPVTLAWATTIHKSQGSSIDRVHVNLNQLWECGQAYVAVSRARSPDGLFIEKWSASSIKADETVVNYYSNR